MFSFAKLSTRQLVVASLYGLAALGAVAGAINAGVTGALSETDLALTAVGVASWGVAAAQGLYRRIKAKKTEVDLEQGNNTCVDDKQLSVTTHAKINSLLHVVSSSCFLTSDAVKLASINLPLAASFSGSLLWLKSAAFSYLLAQKQEKKLNSDVKEVSLFGMKESSVNLLIEVEYLASAVLYTLAIYSNPTLNIFKVPGNIFWLLSATHDTSVCVYKRFFADSPTPVVLNIAKPTIKIDPYPLFKKPSTITIEEIQDTSVEMRSAFQNKNQAINL